MFFLPYDIMDIIILEISKSVLIMIEQIHSFIFYIHSYTYSLNYYNFFFIILYKFQMLRTYFP